ncbi:hypothetical protein GRX66_16135 [Halobacterium sp. PCN9]|uniref:Uncharacterized protein n=1 Tax=Halobacterium bonnevillei TaxID=2692200 RepID=A0A6B0STB3_9EURY|nr:hypothetical protein [Halobacterium bonnevillei]MXR22050.1 hypothetical protein [Halobacterium bonnevillei]
MTDAFAALADDDVRGESSFTLDADHATVAFGAHHDPPGDPPRSTQPPRRPRRCWAPHTSWSDSRSSPASRCAATSRTARASSRAARPSRTWPPSPSAATSASPPTLVAVDRPDLSSPVGAERADGAAVATGDLTLRVVDRDRFRAAVADRA